MARITVPEEPTPIVPISQPIAPHKQQAKRHWGSHSYFTKRAWNVVQEYIKRFSKPGDVVLDPFGGSGVTAVEALVLRRKAIHIDLSPLANFMCWGIAVSPVDMPAYHAAFADIRRACETDIQALYDLSSAEIDAKPIPYWYPKDVPLPPNSDVPTVEALFHRRSLIALSILLHEIAKIEDDTLRELYRLVFSATLTKTNLTFSSTTGRLESRGDSGIFRVYRYWVPPKTVELNVWEQFELRYRGWAAAKAETNSLIGDYFSPGETITIAQGSATDLSELVPDGSVDYIYTDPPYGAHIAYLDLSTMWHAWLGFDVSEADRSLEVIEGGSQGKSRLDYTRLLAASIEEMFRVLKWDGWLSMVFAHKEAEYWETIVRAAEQVGFEYVNTAVQPSTTPSMHKRKNPLKVLSGELVINFHKVQNPRTIAISTLGDDVVELIKNTAELVVVRNEGASTETIYNTLIPVLIEHGLLGVVKKQVPDITALLHETFDYDEPEGLWYIRPNARLGSFIPLQERIRFYVVDFLKRAERERTPATFDDIVFSVMPNLINGVTPKTQSILEVLKEIADAPDRIHWQLCQEELSGFSQMTLNVGEQAVVPVLPAYAEPEHDELIYRLAKLALAAGIRPHIGKKEQASRVHGESLAELGGGRLDFGGSSWEVGKVDQIDCLFIQDEAHEPVYAFEVEGSTPITTGIDRFMELLKVNPKLAKRLVIIVPRKRAKKLNSILSDSHYIGHPLYMENKLVYLYYEDLLRLYARFAGKKPPTWLQLRDALDAAVQSPKVG